MHLDPTAVHRAIAGLFPRFVRCAVQPISERCRTPFPEELHAVASAVPSRRTEFTCGRACAHAAVRALGVADTVIPMASTRAPAWPQGVVGAISHTRIIAAAAVCRSADARGVGLDLELADAPMDERVRRLVLTSAEIAQVADLRSVEQRAPALIFSAKECVHKIVAPLWGWSLDHQEVEISIDLEESRFVAAVRRRVTPTVASPLGDEPALRLRGSFSLFDDHVATGITLDRGRHGTPPGAARSGA